MHELALIPICNSVAEVLRSIDNKELIIVERMKPFNKHEKCNFNSHTINKTTE